MAGVDYSHVHEPDYNPNALQQSVKLNEYIKQVAETAIACYTHPEQFYSYNNPPGTYYTRNKNIFYDTDGIHEQQTESVMVCEACSGILSH